MDKNSKKKQVRNLAVILGDQLKADAGILRQLNKDRDAVWLAEVEEEAAHVWSHKVRLTAFFAAMRHFRDELEARGFTVHYTQLTAKRSEDRGKSLGEVLRKDVHVLRPDRLLMTRPGDWRVLTMLKSAADDLDIPLDIVEDDHFMSGPDHFADWARSRDSLLMETFYRQMRHEQQVLVTNGGKPERDNWNFDKRNRESFPSSGPGKIKSPRRFQPDSRTREVMALVDKRYSDHPGGTGTFHLPVTHGQARDLLRDFIKHRLANFGAYEDAMWSGHPYLYHSGLSAAMNLKLIGPRDCIDAAVQAYKSGDAPINSVEGYVRQVLGWREFMRGIYWQFMPDYRERNALHARGDVPPFYWNGKTGMECMRQSMEFVLEHSYAHHIHRLMVFGNFALLLGVHPVKFHDWHLAMYADAVDWVSLPNTLGMSQFADGGVVATKPYCASGNYINKMSDFCRNCRYRYRSSDGDDACPVTVMYWDFLIRHRGRFADNARMKFQLKNLDRKNRNECRAITKLADRLRNSLDQI